MVRQNNKSIITILRRYSKVITAFLVVNFLTSLVYPMASFALTSGPTAPDFASFEPVDVTDMVDLQTGDFAYNMPLLEVPGPAGGYPISLGYHAGIQTNQEASWVGLGWTLNPGAINRSVNGFADDFTDVENITRSFWSGGTTDELRVGVTIGLPGSPASVSGGLSVASDSYRGLKGKVGYYSGVGAGFGGRGLGVNLGYSYGDNPVTGFSQNGSLGLSYSRSVGGTALNLTGSAGLSTNFNSVSFGLNGGVSATNLRSGRTQSLLGASLSSANGGSVSASVGGFSSNIHNSNAGRISSSTRGFGISIPIHKGVWLDIAKTNYRYWIDEMLSVSTNGAMNFDGAGADLETTAFDVYTNPDEDLFVNDIDDSDKTLGGTFAEYDHYNVTAQGVGGPIRPYAFQRHLYRQNKGEEVIHYETGNNTDRPEFRFVGDFSNRYEYDAGTIKKKGEDGTTDPVSYAFGTPRTGEANDDTDGLGGISQTKLYGSKDVEYFTNAEITTFQQNLDDNISPTGRFINFINNQSTGFIRNPDLGDQIGGFIVTNESGVRYHYTLPAYSYGEKMYSERIDVQASEKDYNLKVQPEPYAYIWHLTAITGPDFVDRGGGASGSDPDGILSDDDWGYWVEFDYGLWTEKYHWRNPGVGYNRDLDGNFQNASNGTKELYYLDAVKTRSHTALFHKSVRADAKSRNNYATLGGKATEEAFHTSSIWQTTIGGTTIFRAPVPSLRLDSIQLVQNEDLPARTFTDIKATNESLCLHENDLVSGGGCFDNPVNAIPGTVSYFSTSEFFSKNVLDNGDLVEGEIPALRTIKFNYSYELQPETINSYDEEAWIYTEPHLPDTDFSELESLGKLTLEGVQFAGRDGKSLVPETTFSYDLKDEGYYTTLSATNALQNYEGLTEGDLIKATRTTDNATAYYYVFKGGLITFIKPLGKVTFNVGDPILVQKTKNAPYDPDARDIWGMYKADVNMDLVVDNEILARFVSNESKKNLDAWSLRSIKTPLGADINIEYQPDRYEEVALAPTSVYQVSNVREGSQTNTIEVEIPYSEQAYETIAQYSFLDLSLAAEYHYYDNSYTFPDDPDLIPNTGGVSVFHEPSNWWYDQRDANRTKSIPINLRAYVQQKNIIGNNIVLALSMDINEYNKLMGVKEVVEYDQVVEIRSELDQDLLPGTYKVHYNMQGGPSFILGGYASKSQDQSGAFVVEGTEPGTYGGGLAVKSISFHDVLDGETTRTNYSYNNGVTSYEPYGILPAQQSDDIPEWFENADAEIGRVGYFQYLSMITNARDLPAPGVLYGNVKIQEMSMGTNIPGHTEYNFETFKAGMVDVHTYAEQRENEDTDETYGDITYKRTQRRSLAIKDFTARVGNVKSIVRYDVNGHKLNETINHYLSDSITDDSFNAHVNEYENYLRINFQNQGVVEETFMDARFAQQEAPGRYYLMATLSKKERFPSVMTGTTTKDYKTGIESASHYLDFDYYSGQPTLTYNSDEYGNQFINRSIPAYRMQKGVLGVAGKQISDAYPNMGLKGKDPENKNMISQEGIMVSFKMKDTYGFGDSDWKNKIDGIMGGTITTWEDGSKVVLPGGATYNGVLQNNIYRKNGTYSFIGIGKTSDNGVHQLVDGYSGLEESWALSDGEPDLTYGWQEGGKITLYDIHSNALEASDINGNYAATKLDLDQERVLATASNASYDQFTYTGFEDGVVSGSILGSNLQLLTHEDIVEEGEFGELRPHTGKASLLLFEGHEGLKFTIDDPDFPGESGTRNYMVSVWSSEIDGLDINYRIGTDPKVTADKLPTKQAGNWYLHRAIIPWEDSGQSTLVISLEAHNELQIDDFRVHPVDAVMTSYVYNKWGEMAFQHDANNLFSQYLYDSEGRLTKVFRESFKHGVKQVSDFKIHYAELNEITEN